MLRIRLDELSATDRDRLRTEVASTLLRAFTRTPFLDPQSRAPSVVPSTRADQARVVEFMAAAWHDDQAPFEITSSAVTDYLVELFTRFLQANLPGRRELRTRALAEQYQAVPLAAALRRRLVGYVLDGVNPDFGSLPDARESWNQGELVPWDRVARSTQRLAAALAAVRAETTLAGPDAAAEPVTMALPVVADLSAAPAQVVVEPQRMTGDAIAQHLTAPLPRPVDDVNRRDTGAQDRAIFQQLRQQLLQALETAAHSYGVAFAASDPAGTLAGLRAVDAIDEADLRLAEGILAVSARVIGEGRADLETYRQALMLYLLFHRTHFAHS